MSNGKLPKEEKKELLEEQQKQEKLETTEPKLLKETDLEKLSFSRDLSKGQTDPQRIADLEDTLKRVQADFDNFRKRYEKEKQELVQQGSAIVISKLLPVVDELEHILAEAKKHNAKEAAGLESTYNHLIKLLESEHVREMKCIGEGFDPYKHEAIKSEPSDLPEHKIVSVLKKGYYLSEHVLRHAIVIISSGNKKEEGEKNGK